MKKMRTTNYKHKQRGMMMEVEVDLGSEMLTKANEGLQYYKIIFVDKALGEDSRYVEGPCVGYGLINLATGVIEHTSTVLPGVMWQAQHFEQTLKSLLEPETTGPVGVDSDDVVPLLQ